jgi:polar amino acid transport system substrate-binding protein
MRKVLLASALLALAASVAACGTTNSSTTSTTGSGTTTPPSQVHTMGATCANSAIQGQLYHRGQLTMATDNPVYVPWFWANKPANGLGYEGAVAAGVAHLLGFTKAQVKWAYEPFNNSYAPGPKKFDFDINEISITAARAEAVTFSIGYYADTQALVALKSGPLVNAHTPAELRTYVYGDQIGTTSIEYIAQYLRPTTTTKVFQTTNVVKSALLSHQIQAFVTDTPTAQYIATTIPGAVVIGQFPSTGEDFGLLFPKGDGLVTCVNRAIDILNNQGDLAKYAKKYLQIYNVIPVIKP